MATTKIQSYDDLQQLFENKQYEFKQLIERRKRNVQFTQIISCPLSDKRSEYQNEMVKDLIKILGNKNVNYGKGVSGRIVDDKSKNLKASVVSIGEINYSLVYKDPSKPVTKTKTGEFSRAEIIKAFQAKFVLRYPRVKGLDIYLDGVGQAAFDHLCGGP